MPSYLYLLTYLNEKPSVQELHISLTTYHWVFETTMEILKRNSERSQTDNFVVLIDTSKIIRQNQEIFNTWSELWLITNLPGFIAKPKWVKPEINLKKGDTIYETRFCIVFNLSIWYGSLSRTWSRWNSSKSQCWLCKRWWKYKTSHILMSKKSCGYPSNLWNLHNKKPLQREFCLICGECRVKPSTFISLCYCL